MRVDIITGESTDLLDSTRDYFIQKFKDMGLDYMVDDRKDKSIGQKLMDAHSEDGINYFIDLSTEHYIKKYGTVSFHYYNKEGNHQNHDGILDVKPTTILATLFCIQNNIPLRLREISPNHENDKFVDIRENMDISP